MLRTEPDALKSVLNSVETELQHWQALARSDGQVHVGIEHPGERAFLEILLEIEVEIGIGFGEIISQI